MSRMFPLVLIILLLALPASLMADGGALDVVVIDAGHGGFDTGIRTPDGLKEKDQTLLIARQMQSVLTGKAKNVYLTRKVDRYMTMEERASEANTRTPDLFVSIHMSDSENFAIYITRYDEPDEAMGLEDYYRLDNKQRRHLYDSNVLSYKLGEAIRKSYNVHVFHREVQLKLLGAIGAPAVMVEVPAQGMDYSRAIPALVRALTAGIGEYEKDR